MKVIMFHDVYNNENNNLLDERNKITGLLNIKDFEKKIIYLKDNFKIINLNDYKNKNYKEEDFEKLCILTFDDGLKNQYDNVLPILQKYNLSGVFFISAYPILEQKICQVHKIQFLVHNKYNINNIFKETIEKLNYQTNDEIWNKNSISLIENNSWSSTEIFLTKILRKSDNELIVNELFEKYILNKINKNEEEFVYDFYMSLENLKELHKTGMEIGVHGYYHNDKDNIDSIKKTQDFLKNIGIFNSNYYSYPNGIINKEEIKMLEFEFAFTTENRDYKKEEEDNYLIPRINCVNINNNNDYKIVLCGIQEQGLEICKYLIKNNIKISCMITLSKENSIKNNASGWVCYKDFCENNNIQLYYCQKYKLNGEEDLKFFQKQQFNLLLLGGWQRLIPENILKTIKYGGIGQHGSSELLPRGRGRSPLNWSIILNRKRLIWNIFFMTPGVDDGHIIDNKTIDINEFDTCKTLYYKIGIIVKQMYVENIPKILNNTIISYPQKGEITFYEKRNPEDGLINWKKPMEEIYNLIRAVTNPYPGAYTYNGLNKIFIWKAQPFDKIITYPNAEYGEIVEIFGNEFVVNCIDGLLLVTNHNAINLYVKDILHNL